MLKTFLNSELQKANHLDMLSESERIPRINLEIELQSNTMAKNDK